MNRINPIYFISLLVVLILFLSIQLLTQKDEFYEAKQSYIKTKELSDKIVMLRNSHVNQKKEIQNILSNPILKMVNIRKKITNNGIKISSDNMKLDSLNYLMSKLLNGAYNIKMLNIRRVNDNKAILMMELKW